MRAKNTVEFDHQIIELTESLHHRGDMEPSVLLLAELVNKIMEYIKES